MAKAMKVLCDRCEGKIRAGTPFCHSCGFPTEWASHEQRTQWEVAQWRGSTDVPHSPRPAAAKRGLSLRPIGERRAPARATATTSAATAAAVAAEPASAIASVTEIHADLPDEEVTRAVLLALNERVRELEMRLRRIEGEPTRRRILRKR
jgi:hypothetical protein